ncbi:MAG TPA: ATP-binding protein [Chloroflexaceae bacterium]|nr:ATP-binding protein [Chloroflexaceae bacterium]
MLVSLTAADFLRYLTWAIFLLIGLWVVLQAIRRPTVVNIDVALLFGGLATAIILNALIQLGLLPATVVLSRLISSGIIAMPFLLVRLMDDVVGLPPRLVRIFMGAFALYLAAFWLVPAEIITAFALPLVLGLLATLVYVVVVGLRAVRATQGVTRRRLIAVSAGSLFLALNFGAGRLPLAPEDVRSLVDIFGVAAGVSYYVGFAPPRWLRRIWQGPELRAFLARSASLPQVEDTTEMLRALEQGAAAALGAPHASLGLWDAAAEAIHFPTFESAIPVAATSDLPVARALRLQQPIFSRDTHYDPALESRFRLRAIARAVLAAPIIMGGQRLGVLSVYGPRVSLFAEDDLELLQLLAEQTAVVLESRRLGERTSRVRAREEAARLKEDFLSTAAHDLKTPLTTIVVQAQLAARRAARNPDAPADQAGLQRMVTESERLRAMVLELLDAARAEQAQLVGMREPVDMAALVRSATARLADGQHRVAVEAPEQLVGSYDARRIAQLVDNLVENAVKYSPRGGEIAVRLWEDEAGVQLTVSDRGIGIPAEDLPYLFERFHRGANVDDRRFPGWGLGLSICRRIVEQHGGTIAVRSREGEGSTFAVTLPAAPAPEEPQVAPPPHPIPDGRHASLPPPAPAP